MHKSFKLLTFNVYDRKGSHQDEDVREADSFVMQMFGLNEKGKTCCLFVEGYQPFFYVKVDSNWGNSERIALKIKLEEEMGRGYEDSITATKIVRRKKLYGFDAESFYKFVLLKFNCVRSMNKAKSLWYIPHKDGRRLKPKGYFLESTQSYLELYEANIPPLLRYFHIQNISPSGWVAVPNAAAKRHTRKQSTCDFEYTVQYNKLISLPEKETIVPYKICSFDIEASSSHGDFPVPKKNYKKLATEIVDSVLRIHKSGNKEDIIQNNSLVICDMIRTAFGFASSEDIDTVYPKRVPTSEELERQILRWTKLCPAVTKNEDDDTGVMNMFNKRNRWSDDECEEDEPDSYRSSKLQKIVKRDTTVVKMLYNNEQDRETLINEVTKTLNAVFPPLEGDTTTFIGSTFLKYGSDKPYLNHCAVLGDCNDLPQVDNSKIETYDTERELLLAWAKLIKEEDPDIIIGYNIFGFDYEFLFRRSQELNCVEPFLKLSRNKGEPCFTKDYRTGRINIEESSIQIASGQHDLHYVKMNGRLQIDLYNYFRREFNLTSYKLDYVAGHCIGDAVKKIEHIDGCTRVHTKNLIGLDTESYICFEESSHTTEPYDGGRKMKVISIDYATKTFMVDGEEMPDMEKRVRWGLAKDDVTPQDIFRLTKEGPAEKAIIAKYCIQDCNLVQQILRKVDVVTGFIEMAKLCSVPMEFLVLRGQGIKLTSYVGKKCREKQTLVPVIDKTTSNEGYEGAIVLDPKKNLYLKKPVACVDYSSLYPSSIISEHLSHDSKVWTKEYDLEGNLIAETGEKDTSGNYIYDNLPEYKYVDVKYDTYKYKRKHPKAAAVKTLCGKKICRFAQFPKGKPVLPSILEELLAARKATRKLIPLQDDEFMKNILDKRQLSIKITANSLYGQTGAKTSSFYEVDVAASTTAVGRKLLKYAQRLIEEAYGNTIVDVKGYGKARTRAEYVYGDTDSVFFTFNLEELDGTPIEGQKALEMTIILAQEAGELATKFLKKPHDLEYEKTFLPFCLLSKKRYVGMLYETDPNKCYRKEMGIVLKRRDNAPIVKDVYGGIIDILMKENDIGKAVSFLRQSLQDIVDGKCPMDKLIITKSLRGHYKNPQQIAHKVLADRMGRRDPGNKPASGDRIPFAYVETKVKAAKQGEKIEHPSFIKANNLRLDYSFYISNQIMKPVLQVFALVLEQLPEFRRKKGRFVDTLATLKCTMDEEAYEKKESTMREKEVKAILFDDYLRQTNNAKAGNRSIVSFFG